MKLFAAVQLSQSGPAQTLRFSQRRDHLNIMCHMNSSEAHTRRGAGMTRSKQSRLTVADEQKPRRKRKDG